MDGPQAANDGIPLRQLLADAELIGADDVRIAHCTSEAQNCREGDLFVAIVDDAADGHDQIHQAVRLGAAAVVASRPVSVDVPVCYVPDTRVAYAQVCHALAGNPSEKLRAIGVAGSFGKTTTGYLIASVLTAGGRTPGVLGSLGYCDGVEIADARWTTPPPPVAAAWLSRMAANGCTHAIVEASPRGIRLAHTASIRFDACCVTNIFRDLRRGDAANSDDRRAVARLLEQLAPEGLLVANVDDPGAAALAAEHEGPLVTVGLDAPAEVSATIIERHRSEQTFLLSFGNEVIPVRTTLVGRHNVRHCLIAAALGTAYGLDPATIVRGLESVVELPGRLERIECGQPFGVFLDDARTSAALEACLETLRGTTERRLMCVYATSAEDDGRHESEFRRVIGRWCDEAIASAPTGRSRSRIRSTTHEHRTPDRAEAIGRALRAAEEGDCILIAGGADETYALADREQDYWDDRQLVRQALYRLMNEELPHRKAI